MKSLAPVQKRYLKSKAHHLKPLAQVGKNGVTERFCKEVQVLLGTHELIKIKFNEFKDEKKSLSSELAATLAAHEIAMVGNTAIFFKENRVPEKRKYLLPAA
jgi:RNA-binding protein